MKPKIIWKPLPGSQCLALTAPCNHILYEGTRGPGKTDCQLMRFRRHVGQGYGQFWRGIILDKRYKSLDDLISKSKRWFPQFNDGAKFLSSNSSLKWVWPSGEELLFRVMEKEDDYWNYHGMEFPFIGWNELTKYPTSACFDAMLSTNRSSFIPEEHSPKDKGGVYKTPDRKPLPPIPLLVFSTTNPHGVGHNWVKRRFIDPAEPGKVVRKETDVFNPRTQERQPILKTQVRIFGSYRENRYLPPEYIADLEGITDPNKRAAWLQGSWDITAGGALDDLWRSSIHKIPRSPIPANWRLTRSFDWGSSHPFSVGFWAISNGEEITLPGGKVRSFPRGSLIRIDEIYGSALVGGERYGHNQGQKKAARKIAREIKEKEEVLRLLGWIEGTVEPGPADNQISNVNEEETHSIAKLMEQEGVAWTKSDKSKGTRKTGLELVRNALENARTGEGAGLYVMDNCEAFLETVPSIPRDEDDPDDVDCWVAGTMVSTPQGDRPIEEIKAGDWVNTPIGARQVLASYASGLSETVKVTLVNGTTLEGTPDHKVFVRGKGLVPLSCLDSSSVLVSIRQSCLKKPLTGGLFTRGLRAGDTTHPTGLTSLKGRQAFTVKYGLITTDQSRKVFTSIIKMGIRTTTRFKTLKSFLLRNMPDSISTNAGGSTQIGQRLKRANGPCEATLSKCLSEPRKEHLRALIVGALLEQNTLCKNGVSHAGKRGGRGDTVRKLARFVGRCLVTSPTQLKRSKLAVRSVVGSSERKRVYNITVQGAHLFFANGVLSSNTDAEDHCFDEVRYMVLDNKPVFAGKIKIGFAT